MCINKIKKFFLISIFFLVPIFFSDIGAPLGISVNGNFEFTKTIFSILLISMISFFSIISVKKIKIEKYIVYIIIILVLSSTFSINHFDTIFGTSIKGHGLVFYLTLISFYTLLKHIGEKEKKIINICILLSSILVSIIGIIDFFIQNNGGRIISTIGQSNQLAFFLLLSLPIILEKIIVDKQYIYTIGLSIIILCILFSQSLIGIFLSISYGIFIIYKRRGYTTLLTISILGGILGVLIFSYFPEKIHSLVSRYYIWETTLKIIFSDIKIFFIGAGPENFPQYFSNFKSPYLYIYENFGFTADRSHNLYLDIFFHFGVFALIGNIFLIKNVYNKAESVYKDILIIFFIFSFFNPISVVNYIVGIFALSQIPFNNTFQFKNNKYIQSMTLLISIVLIFFAFSYYKGEVYAKKNIFHKAILSFPSPKYYYAIGDYEKGRKIEKYKSEDYFISKIDNNLHKTETCTEYIKHYKSAESYFYCGQILERNGEKEKALEYYQKGVNKLPDLRNKDSLYWKNILIKQSINGNRFFSVEYSNIDKILKKLGIEKDEIQRK